MTTTTDAAMLNKSGYERIAHDAYWTPPWCVEVLLRHLPLIKPCHIWEPACGIGNISKTLYRAGYKVASSDLHNHGFGITPHDFLTCEPPPDLDAIITNPPYELAVEFVTRALALMQPRCGIVAMLLRNEWDCASTRTHLFKHLTLKLVLTKRPKWAETDVASPRHNFSWFVWNFADLGGPPRIIWDKP